MYKIPEIFLEEFLKIAKNNLSSNDNGLIETLAYLIGYDEGGEVLATELIFPKQNGSPSLVLDEGKCFQLSARGTLLHFGKICSKNKVYSEQRQSTSFHRWNT